MVICHGPGPTPPKIMPRWTLETRLKQAERARTLCLWKKFTGPRTSEGKARSARNAWKGGKRALVDGYAKILRDIAATTRVLFSSFRQKPNTSCRAQRMPGRRKTDRDLFSSFGANIAFSPGAIRLPPMSAGADNWPTEAVVTMAQGLLGGGLFSSFGAEFDRADSPSGLTHEQTEKS